MYYKQDCKYQILRIQFRPYNRKFEISAVKPVGGGGFRPDFLANISVVSPSIARNRTDISVKIFCFFVLYEISAGFKRT